MNAQRPWLGYREVHAHPRVDDLRGLFVVHPRHTEQRDDGVSLFAVVPVVMAPEALSVLMQPQHNAQAQVALTQQVFLHPCRQASPVLLEAG